MAGPATRIRVKGARELEAAFLEMRREVLAGLKPALLEAGAEVAQEAHRLAPGKIPNIGGPWSEFRIGATVKGVYIAPKRRRRGGSPRRNMGGLLLDVMEEAVDRKQDRVVANVEAVIQTSKLRTGL